MRIAPTRQPVAEAMARSASEVVIRKSTIQPRRKQLNSKNEYGDVHLKFETEHTSDLRNRAMLSSKPSANNVLANRTSALPATTLGRSSTQQLNFSQMLPKSLDKASTMSAAMVKDQVKKFGRLFT